MKKTLLTNLKYIAFGVVMAVGISYAYAAWGTPSGTYTDPTGAPTSNNADTPLNVGPLDQIKSGGSCIAGNCGGLSLGGSFIASQNAEFDGQVFLHGIVGADSNGVFPASSTVQFGGLDSKGYMHSTNITMSGGLAAATLKSAALVNSAGTSALCADASGNVVFCTITDMCSNIAGAQTTVPVGDQQNSDGSCTAIPKHFLAVIPYQKYTNPNFVGNVINGQMQDHVPQAPGVTQIPLVDQIGFYNGNQGSNWIYNQIPGMLPTDFNPNGTQLLAVGQAGSYTFKISSDGNVGIQGKFAGDIYNAIGVDFYMKINSQWIRMDNASSTMNHEAYPVPGKNIADFGSSSAQSAVTNGNGTTWKYIPYSLRFNQTFTLSPGDTVDVYAFIYGSSYRPSSNNNFSYSIDASNTTYDITEQ